MISPWQKTLRGIRARCSRPGSYKDKGILCLITSEQLKKLWFRDKAELMSKASIHRKNAKLNYTIRNCEYIEYTLNCGITTWTKQRRKMMAEKAKKQYRDPIFLKLRKKSMEKVLYKLHRDPEFIKRRNERIKKINKEMSIDPKHTKRRREQGKKQMENNWKDPEFRKMRSRVVRKQWREGKFKRKLKKENA